MSFGRVDVYWPDGPIESYRLDKAAIAIGRSTGNDIVLDTTSISRYHITLTFKNQQVLLEDLDSVNGTYVDGVRLAAHEPYVLRGGEEIQIGDIRLIYHSLAALQPPAGEADATQRVVLVQPTYRVELEGPELGVAPGAHVQTAVKIHNLSTETDHYFVEIDGLPKGWARADRVELEVEPDEQAQVVISIKPLRRSETQPGEHPFVVRVRSKSRPADTIDALAILRVLPFSGFGMALGNPRVEDGTGFTLYLHNQGNAPLPLSLQGIDPAQALHIQLARAQVQLGPGERQSLAGTVRARRQRLFGPDREREFALVARAHDASGFLASVPGTYIEKGALPAWMPVLAVPVLGLAVLLLVAMAALMLRGNQDDSPVTSPLITAFGAVNSSVALGDLVEVRWDVSGAQAIELVSQHAGTEQRYALDPATTTFPLRLDETGQYTLVLEAHNGTQTNTASAVVEVRPSVGLALRVLEGDELVRHVQHIVRVTWQVSGARPFDGGYSIWLERSDQVRPLLAAPMPLAGEQDIQVILSADQPEWLVTLYAEGADGVVASVTQKLPVVLPICELKSARTTVRSGPGTVYPAIMPPQPPEGSPAGTLSYSPVARNPGGDWLKVIVGLDSRPGWVPRSDFTCTNFNPDFLVVTDDYPAPPASTPLPQVEGTATPAVVPPRVTPSPAAPTPARTAPAATPTPTQAAG